MNTRARNTKGGVPSLAMGKWMIKQCDGVEVCVELRFCTTLRYVIVTVSEDKFGDAVCTQSTALMPNTWLLTRFFMIPFTGREHRVGDTLRIQRLPC